VSETVLVSRGQLAELANQSGMNITERTLKFWAGRGLIPKPIIISRRAHYPVSLLERLRIIESLRRKSIAEMKDVAEQVWNSSKYRYRMRRSGNTIILNIKPRGDK